MQKFLQAFLAYFKHLAESSWQKLQVLDQIPIMSLLIIALNVELFYLGYQWRLERNDLFSFDLLLHAVSHANYRHLAGNMFFMAIILPLLELFWKTKARLIYLYLISAVFCGLFFMLPLKGQTSVVGASGVLFSYLAIMPFVMPTRLLGILWLGIVGLRCYTEWILMGRLDGIAHEAHILGAIIGLIFFCWCNRSKYIFNLHNK